MKWGAILFLALVGCQTVEPIRVCADPTLEAQTIEAVERWNAAGEVAASYDCETPNVRVRFAEPLISTAEDGEMTSGNWIAGAITISPATPEKWIAPTVAHELGHAIAGNGKHSETGLMMEVLERPEDPIDEASLGTVCAGEQTCAAWNPEI